MMRRKWLGLGALVLLASSLPLDGPARAFDAYHQCRYVDGYCDPYAYEYRPTRYYPYYNSGDWVPAWAYRRPPYPYVIPPYYKAWGYPKRYTRHGKRVSRRHARRRSDW